MRLSSSLLLPCRIRSNTNSTERLNPVDVAVMFLKMVTVCCIGNSCFPLILSRLWEGKAVSSIWVGMKVGKLSRFSRCDASPQQLSKMSFNMVSHLAPMDNAPKIKQTFQCASVGRIKILWTNRKKQLGRKQTRAVIWIGRMDGLKRQIFIRVKFKIASFLERERIGERFN